METINSVICNYLIVLYSYIVLSNLLNQRNLREININTMDEYKTCFLNILLNTYLKRIYAKRGKYEKYVK